MTPQTMIEMLIGETLTAEDPYGQDLTGPELYAGYIPPRGVLYSPPLQIGDGLAGPVNEQPLQIFRDLRPIATDELGMQGPFNLEIGKWGRHRAGRSFPLNLDWDRGHDRRNPGLLPEQDSYVPTPLGPGQLPAAHDGFRPVELTPNVNTVYYTASPHVGWTGY